jgi:hypothetical protein
MIEITDIFSNPLAVFAIFAAIFLTIVFIHRARKMPYRAQDTLLTNAELKFYRVLKQAAPKDTLIMMKVRMGDLITCDKSDWQKGWGPRISAKHIDFVLIDAHTTAIKLAIELDDSTHRTNQDRIARDKFVNDAFKVADIPLLRIDTQRYYNAEKLKKEINQTTVPDLRQR